MSIKFYKLILIVLNRPWVNPHCNFFFDNFSGLARIYSLFLFVPGCLQIACVILQKDHKSWFAELNVDIEKIQEIARYIINLFDMWKAYDEKKEIQGLLGKMPKPKPAPQR